MCSDLAADVVQSKQEPADLQLTPCQFGAAGVALLIDADNTPYFFVEKILEISEQYGELKYRKVFGNWSQANKKYWQNELLKGAFEACHLSTVAVGKNAADVALTVAAMDIMFSDPSVNTFVIVSSDADFSALSTRLRRSGKNVIGIGRSIASEAYRDSLDEYFELNDDIRSGLSDFKNAVAELLIIVDEFEQNEEVLNLSVLCDLMNKRSKFDIRAFGFTKFNEFVKSVSEVDVVPSDKVFIVKRAS